PAKKREPQPMDYGFVGDVNAADINIDILKSLLDQGMFPVISPITHDGNGQLLNTNADTIAAALAIALSNAYETALYYCFEKKGVLSDLSNDYSVIEQLSNTAYKELKNKQLVHAGMIPKLDNAFEALTRGVQQVVVLHAKQINDAHAGTRLVE
ncbi:MAG: acetylglutamate kinase, partial [Bacteroidota bacterium]